MAFVSQKHDLRVTIGTCVELCDHTRKVCRARSMANFLSVGFQPVDRCHRLSDLSSIAPRAY